MKLITNDPKISKAIEQINAFANLHTKKKEYEIVVNWNEKNEINWEIDKNIITISCKTKTDLMSALGDALSSAKENGSLTKRFEKLESMVDVSRNAVYTLDKMKNYLCQLALMGYTGCLLYMEDTYELPDYPYWGYQRGRYTTEELKELDDFAFELGIELIGCIQTLAHLRTALRWSCFDNVKDTPDNILVGAKETNELVEKMLVHFKNTLRTDRIHLGMDESFGLGMGRYRLLNGFKDHRILIREHLKTVCEMCKKYGLKPMIWDDMLFRDDTPIMQYYCESEPISDDEVKKYPDNLTFVYWDYYQSTKEQYLTQLKRRGNLKTVFAGGMWKWGGFTPNYTKSFKASKSAINACIEHGVDEIIVTAWGDDGAEAPLDCLIAGMAFYGLNRFYDAKPEDTQNLCKLLADCDFKLFTDIEKLDLIPNMPSENLDAVMPHKNLLYGDIASDRYLYNMGCKPEQLIEHYSNLEKLYKNYLETSCNDYYIELCMKTYHSLANVLKIKCETGILLHTSWENKDIQGLKNAQKQLLILSDAVRILHENVINMWSASCKGQGLEVLNLRLGGLQGRYKAVYQRLELYICGKIKTITELDEKIISSENNNSEGLRRDMYGDIVTANTLYHFSTL